jgi:ferric-dicitrate binding protein FerR (iron transport regulator)
MQEKIETLLEEVGRTVEAEARRRNLRPALQARLAALEVGRPRRAIPFGLALAGAALCAGLIGVLVLRPRPLSFAVAGGGAGAIGRVGQTLTAPATGALDLRFSDGSAITLPARAAAHVDAVDARGATVAIDDGTLEVSVVHRARTRWQVRAGGYEIRVTGTRFAAGWDRRAQALTVTMHDGSVVVTGPGVAQPVRVVTGQRLRVSAEGGAELGGAGAQPPQAAAAATGPAPAPAVASSAPPREAGASAPAAAAPPAARDDAAAVARTAAPSRARRAGGAVGRLAMAGGDPEWKAEAARARYHDALAAAVQEGWRAECGRLGADDLLLLGDVARFAGDLDRADEAYRIARRRFPDADRPVFALGLIAFEGRHDYQAAAGWFASYLQSFPRGPLAREAAGRLLESRLKAGDQAGARTAAQSYLRAFPDGTHADLAKRTVGP